MKRCWLLALSLVVGLAAACSQGGTQGVTKDAGAEEDAGPVTGDTVDGTGEIGAGDAIGPQDGEAKEPPDGAGEAGDGGTGDGSEDQGAETQDAGPPDVGPGVTVNTYAASSVIPAGVALPFTCKVQGLQEGTYATYLHISGPADVDVADLTVTFYKVGGYKVACVVKWAEGEVEDQSPLEMSVTPGEPATIDTALSESKVKAGQSVTVTCTILDAFGNAVLVPAKVAVDPQVGLTVIGVKIIAEKVGTYKVACVEPASGVADDSPETLTVTWNVPTQILTDVAEATIVAGTSTTVECTALDAYGNEVPDFPLAVFLSPGLSLAGFSISGTKAGAYQVICVPQSGSWDLFKLDPKLLTVIPGAPVGVTLQAVPPKPVYKMFEIVSFIVSAVDEYGNMVEGVELLPLTHEPADPGVLMLDAMTFKFETEGKFVFKACIKDTPWVCGEKQINVDGYGPVITIKFPSRGATIMGKPSVVVVGNVVDPVSGIKSFEINGQYVPLDENGDFTFPISSKQGMNMIVAVAEDPNGFKTLLVQAYYYSPVWYKVDINDPEAAKMKDALLFFLSTKFFDDWDHGQPPNDLSTIIEMALNQLDIGSFFSNPVASAGPYKVYVGPFSHGPPVVHIWTKPGGLQLEFHLYGAKVHVEANGECKFLFIDFCPDVSGEVVLNEMTFFMGLNLGIQDGVVTAYISDDYIGLYGIEVNIDGIIGFLFGWIVDWFVGSYVSTLEQTALTMIEDQVNSMLLSLVDMLALNYQMEVPNPINPDAPPVTLSLVSTIQLLEFDSMGATVIIKPAVLAPKMVNHSPLGSIGRASCLKWVPEKFEINKEKYAHIGVADDFVNEMLFSAWYGGLLNMTIPLEKFVDPASLGDLGFGSLEDLGIKDITVTTDFFLPPIITSCNPYEKLQLEIGDAYIELNMKMLNEPVSVGMFMSMAAEAEITVTPGPDGPEIGLAIGEIDPLVAQVTYISDNLKGAEGFMTMIIQAVLLPSIAKSFAEKSLANFALPAFDISSLSPMLPGGIVWKFVVDKFYRQLGYTSMQAHIENK